jgi:hypothetical protein
MALLDIGHGLPIIPSFMKQTVLNSGPEGDAARSPFLPTAQFLVYTGRTQYSQPLITKDLLASFRNNCQHRATQNRYAGQPATRYCLQYDLRSL